MNVTIDICVYCEEVKPVTVWYKTGELVCRECRHDFVDQEFDGDTDWKRFGEEQV